MTASNQQFLHLRPCNNIYIYILCIYTYIENLRSMLPIYARLGAQLMIYIYIYTHMYTFGQLIQVVL